jgi:hypothetical protein
VLAVRIESACLPIKTGALEAVEGGLTLSKLVLVISLVLLVGGCSAVAQRPQEPRRPQASMSLLRYRALVEQANQRDSKVDFTELIAAYWDSELPEKTRRSPEWDKLVAALTAQNHEKFVALAEKVIGDEFTNRSLHLALEASFRTLGNETRALFHHGVADKLLDALMRMGDGLTPETAYCVPGTDDEYAIMRRLGYKLGSQRLLVGGQDELSGTDEKSGERVTRYFDARIFEVNGFGACVKSHVAKQRR